jgi:hypothetical protein
MLQNFPVVILSPSCLICDDHHLCRIFLQREPGYGSVLQNCAWSLTDLLKRCLSATRTQPGHPALVAAIIKQAAIGQDCNFQRL